MQTDMILIMFPYPKLETVHTPSMFAVTFLRTGAKTPFALSEVSNRELQSSPFIQLIGVSSRDSA